MKETKICSVCPSLALVGAGNWGRNLARNFHQQGVLHSICDINESILQTYALLYPTIKLTHSFESVLSEPSISKIAIATPPYSHYQLAKHALLAGKDIFVEKPLCLKESEVEELAEIAVQKKLILMVGHILQYHPYTNVIQNIIEKGELGDLLEINAERFNPLSNSKEDILWDLAPHDISLFLSFTSSIVSNIHCIHAICRGNGILDEVLLKLQFSSKCKQATIFLSRLKSIKKQKFTIMGTKANLIFDDANPWEKKLIIQSSSSSLISKSEYLCVPYEEPLARECAHFIECCKTRSKPKSHVYEALQVTEIIQAAQACIKKKMISEKSKEPNHISRQIKNVILEHAS